MVTSALTFVPENYNRMICSMAEHPSVVGLLILDNKDISALVKGLFLLNSGSAPRLGWTLIKNYFGNSLEKRKKAYEAFGKKVWTLADINSPEAIDLIRSEKIDLVVNTRTRSIFKKAILMAPTLGCINIHHGLLPNQRGLMCDFWAHMENEDFGFSIHQMTSKIDDGPILRVVKVHSPRKNYLESVLIGSELEAKACKELINEIAQAGKMTGIKNQSPNVMYRRNPSLWKGYQLQWKGIKI